MESLAAGQRVRLDVVKRLGGLDDVVVDRFFRRIDAEILSPPDAEGSMEFRHSVDIAEMLEKGAWAPWTCVAQHVCEDSSRSDVWTMRTRIYADRVRFSSE